MRKPVSAPTPRLLPSFVEEIVCRAGGKPVRVEAEAVDRLQIFVYAWPDLFAALVCFEQAGLDLLSRRERIRRIAGESVSGSASEGMKKTVMRALKGPVREALARIAEALRAAQQQTQKPTARTCLIAVNSGAESLPPGLFKDLISACCAEDGGPVDAAVCLSVHQHSRPFDTRLVFDNDVLAFRMAGLWPELHAVSSEADACFEEALRAMNQGSSDTREVLFHGRDIVKSAPES